MAERLNRTLVEMARSTLLDAKLLKKYWAETIATAVYLKIDLPQYQYRQLLLKHGTEKNQRLVIYEFLNAMHTLTFQRMKDLNLT